MLFNTLEFVIFFSIFLLVITLFKNRNFQYIFLLISSLFFFYYTSNYLIILLLFTICWDFLFGDLIFKANSKKSKRRLLILALAGNLGLLGFFKYADFVIQQINFVGTKLDIVQNLDFLNLPLPIGISFYTFHSLTYIIGIYRGQINPVKSIKEYAIFVTFFPQLVAGPILRAKDFLPQLKERIKDFETGKLRLITITQSNLKLGITIMALGFFKKMFFADNISPLVNNIFLNPIGSDSFTIILGTIGFGIQVYCDFSGYSDIAIGAAMILGFSLPKNFDKPFFATSPASFWNKWHISLSHWVRDYLYYPLIFKNRNSLSRLFFSTFLTMILLGFWHGAGLNWIFFGIMHGLYLGIHLLILHKIPSIRKHSFFKTRIGFYLSIIITQYLVFFSLIAFRVENIEHLFYSLEKFVFIDFKLEEVYQIIISNKIPVFLMIVFFILHYISYSKKNIREKISQFNNVSWFFTLLLITSLIMFFYDGNPVDFIYFQF